MQGSSIELIVDERQNSVSLIRRWGGLSSDALLDSSCKFFSIPTVKGIIGYRTEHACAVVFGDPVCAVEDAPQLAQAFHRFCQERGWRIVYVTVSEKFSKWAIQNICKALVEFGEELFLNPYENPMDKHGTHASLVRRKVRHALKEGATVHEYLSQDILQEEAIEQVGNSWLQSRRGPQVHISRIFLFNDRLGKRWFYAKQGENIVGIVVLNQIQARQGWLLNHLMFTPQAPHGTPELLVISVLEILKQEGCHFVSLGAVAKDNLGEIVGLTKFSSWMARHAYRIAYKVFHLKGHKTFWGKFYPQNERSYLLFSRPQIGLSETIALRRAMNISFTS